MKKVARLLVNQHPRFVVRAYKIGTIHRKTWGNCDDQSYSHTARTPGGLFFSENKRTSEGCRFSLIDSEIYFLYIYIYKVPFVFKYVTDAACVMN